MDTQTEEWGPESLASAIREHGDKACGHALCDLCATLKLQPEPPREFVEADRMSHRFGRRADETLAEFIRRLAEAQLDD